MDQLDEDEGQPERVISKNQQFHKEREQPPRFAQPGTFEYEYAMRWKALLDMEKQQQEQVDRNIREAREKLESEMVAAQHEHQVMLMRQDLLRRQEELRRMEEQHNLEVQKRKQVEMRQEEERRRRSEEAARRQQEAFAENSEKDMRMHMPGQGMAVSRSYMAGSNLPAGPVNMPDVEKPLMHERFAVEQAVSDAMLGAMPPFPRGLSTPPDFGLNKRRGY
ncbi:hypothetical protein Z043_117406 [Scleropages formosus]|nr:hypothetical protein Z043_117406 [Scleropages formosus]